MMTQPSPTLTRIFQHHLWANLGLFESCADLKDVQLDASVSGTFGTIRETLEHITKAEMSYFSRITTGERYHFPKGAPPMTIPEMIAQLRRTGAGLIEWAPKVEAGDSVTIDWDGTPREVPKTVILTQVINHATEHRSHVMTILTQLGIEPPELDAWQHFDAVGE